MSQAPTKLGKYDIVRPIGNGAMGVVYEGFDPIIERTVAIKTIRKEELDPEDAEEHSRRFLIEARAAGKLNHPNIVGIYDYGDEQGLAYIVMEFVQGKELKSYFDTKYNFSLGQTQRLMTEMLEALGYSHHRGVIHRDVKPANLFVTDSGKVKLGDFGIARIDSSQKTHAGTVLGTPSYMSPEQIRGEVVDARSDLYSAGVILYQFLVGERPFSGNMVAIMQKVLAEPPPPPSSKNPAISPVLDALIARALAKSADDRFQNAAEFAAGLASAINASSAEDVDDESTVIMSPKRSKANTLPGDNTGSIGLTASSRTAVGTSPSMRSTTAGTATSSVDELKRQALDAKRRADEEARRIEEQLEQAQAREDQAKQEAQAQFQQISQRADAEMVSLHAISSRVKTVNPNDMLTQGIELQEALLAQQQAVSQELDVLLQWQSSGLLLSEDTQGSAAALTTRLSESEQAAQNVLVALQSAIEAAQLALEERQRKEAEERAAEEARQQKALQEKQQREAEQLALEERQRKEAEERAAEEARQQKALQEKQQREAEQLALEERQRKEAEQRAAEEARQQKALQEKQQREAEQLALEERQRKEAAHTEDETVMVAPAAAPKAPPPAHAPEPMAKAAEARQSVQPAVSKSMMVPVIGGVLVLAGAVAWWLMKAPAEQASGTPAVVEETVQESPIAPLPAPEMPQNLPDVEPIPVPQKPESKAPKETAPTPTPTQPSKDKEKSEPATSVPVPKPATKPVEPAVPAPAPVPVPAKPEAAIPKAEIKPEVVTPKVTTVTPSAATSAESSPSQLYKDGLALINAGSSREGLRLLEQAGNAGNASASKRLMELYSGAESGVRKDYGKAVKWKNIAKSQGVNVGE